MVFLLGGRGTLNVVTRVSGVDGWMPGCLGCRGRFVGCGLGLVGVVCCIIARVCS